MSETAVSEAPVANSPRIVRILQWLTLLLALGGVFVAGVLTAGHTLALSLPCGSGSGCDVVEGDPSSMFLGVPVAAYGFACYLVLALCAIARLAGARGEWLYQIPRILSGLGVVVSAGLTVYSIRNLGVTCAWCLTSATLMLLSFLATEALVQLPRTTRPARPFMALVGVGLMLAVFGAVAYQVRQIESRASTAHLDRLALSRMAPSVLIPSDAHVRGNPKAPVTIVEFGDLTCPTCKAWSAVLKEAVSVSRGSLNLVFRQFPLIGTRGHENALPLAALSEMAAEKGHFWEFVDAVYGVKRNLTPAEVWTAVKRAGLDQAKAEARMKNPKDPVFDRINRDLHVAGVLKLRETPTIIVYTAGSRPEPATLRTLPAVLELPKFVRAMNGSSRTP